MSVWTNDELNKIETAEELQITSLRDDGMLRKWVIIWVARVGDDLYVRSYRGRGGAWFGAAQMNPEGRIRAAGWRKMSPLWRKPTPTSTTRSTPRTTEADKLVVERLAEIAERHGAPRAHISLAWLLHKEPVVAPVIGATKISHLESAVESLSIKLTPEEIDNVPSVRRRFVA